ncbi:MAG: hypothetical protein KAS71_08490, partial [Bacteroidales bacterium]|nr:hypothetical protein [Bacteroidales bacterium]
MLETFLSRFLELIRKTFALPVGFKINYRSLKFDRDIEKIFIREYYDSLLIHVRFSIIISIFFYAIFGVLDWFLIPELVKTFIYIRFLFVIPAAIIILLLSYLNFFQKIYQSLLSLLIFIAGFGIILMIYFSGDYTNSLVQAYYYTGLLLVFIFGYSFLKLRFWWASLASWMIVIS